MALPDKILARKLMKKEKKKLKMLQEKAKLEKEKEALDPLPEGSGSIFHHIPYLPTRIYIAD